jgi:anti-sigma-K factor RskA
MSEERPMSRRDELETLLPFYLNGTLAGAELAEVEDWLASDPAAMVALEEAEREFAATNASNEAIRPPADALSRFARALEREAGPVREAAGPSWLAAAWRRLIGLPAGLAWATAAVAVLLLVAQAAYEFGTEKGGVEIAGTDDDTAKRPFALVIFKADARMADIAAFLDRNDAAIIAGPLPGNMFKVALAAKTVADYDRLVGLIAAQPFTESVVPGKKPAENGS